MKVYELKQIIDNANENDEVVIPAFRAGNAGPQSSIGVKSAYSGFDWDRGKFFLISETTLREIDRDEIRYIQEKYDELAWKKSKIDKLKKINKELTEALEYLLRCFDGPDATDAVYGIEKAKVAVAKYKKFT